MFKKILILSSLILLTACGTFNKTSESKSNTRFDRASNRVLTNTTSTSTNSSTFKYISRLDLARAVCTVAGEEYKQFLVLSDTNVEFLPIVIQDGKYIQLPDEAKIVFNNKVNRPGASPFNMGTCVTDVTKTGMERFFTGFFKDVFKFGRDIIPYAAGYKVAGKFLDYIGDNNKLIADSAGVKVNGVEEGATVAVGTDESIVNVDQRRDQAGDNSTFNTCAGEISETGACVLPVEPGSVAEGEADASTCTGAGGSVQDDDLDGTPDRCSDGEGGTIEDVILI